MNKKEISNLVESQQIAFQFADSLITFTQSDENKYEFESERENVEEMKRCILNCKSLKVVAPEECDETFQELVNWSTPDDTLCLIDDNLLLCIKK